MSFLKVPYQILLVTFYAIGTGGILIEVINPHSFLTVNGALLRIAILAGMTPLWIVFSKYNKKSLLNPGTILFVILMAVYSYAGTEILCQNFAYENKIDYSSYSCPLMLFK